MKLLTAFHLRDCEILDEKYAADEWDGDENENANESEDEDSTKNTLPQRYVPTVACTPEDESTAGNESSPVDPKLMADWNS